MIDDWWKGTTYVLRITVCTRYISISYYREVRRSLVSSPHGHRSASDFKKELPWVTACKLDYLLLIPNPLKVVHHDYPPPGREGEWKVIFLSPRHVLYRLWSFANIVNDTRSLLILNVIRLREIGQMYLARSLIFCWQFISGVVNQHMPTREVDLHIL